MKYEKAYYLQWTYKAPKSIFCRTESKFFETEMEQNKAALELFSRAKLGEIALVEVRKEQYQIWS